MSVKKALDPKPVVPFNFKMELDKELVIRKCKIPDPDIELLKWHIKLNHLPLAKSWEGYLNVCPNTTINLIQHALVSYLASNPQTMEKQVDSLKNQASRQTRQICVS